VHACEKQCGSEPSLRERGTAGGGVRLRKVMVAAQIALSLVLVIGAVLFARTLTALLAKGPGFDTSSLVSFGVDPRRSGYSPSEASQLTRRIHDNIRASATTQASAAAHFPLLRGGSWFNPMTIQADRRIATDRDVDFYVKGRGTPEHVLACSAGSSSPSCSV
jgi:hypothetical protein